MRGGLIVLLTGVAGLAICRWAPGLLTLLPLCRFRAWTSLPCPSCGATSAALALAHGHPGDALRLNPLFTLLYLGMAAAGLHTLAALIGQRALTLVWNPREKSLLLGGVLLLIWLNWLYLLGVRFALF